MATLALIIINIVVSVALKVMAVLSPAFSEWVISVFGIEGSGLEAVTVHPWSLLSYMFIHIRTWHLIMNMLWLLSFGSILEKAYGWRILLSIYLLGGICGGITFIFGVVSSSSLLIGSSAAVLAVAFASITSASFKSNVLPSILQYILLVLTLLTASIFFLHDYTLNPDIKYVHIAGAVIGITFGGGVLWRRRLLIVKATMQAEKQKADMTMFGKINTNGFASLTAGERERIFNISTTNNLKSRQ